ncbi:glycosyltransferase [Sinomonas sp. P10A9]|uniref:Glycosyltransferase n=1 Tax=Sinomonas puerhi TaxID=3238584 RepID=A0AB39L0W6_9MICC
MGTILVAAMPFAGHVNPVASLAGELVRRGHEVHAYTGAKYAERFEHVGARPSLWRSAPDFDDARLAETFPVIGDGHGFRATLANLRHVFIGTAPAQTHDVARLAAAVRPDAVVADALCLGPGMWAQREGIPWASVSLVPLSLHNPWGPPTGLPFLPADGGPAALRNRVLASVLTAGPGSVLRAFVNRARAAAGLGPTRRPGLDSLYSARLTLAQGIAELEYPRPSPVPGVEFIGELAPSSEGALPDWWGSWPAGSHVVHVTQGTLDVDPDELLRPAVLGLAGGAAATAMRPVVVLSTGGGPGVSALPEGVFAADFLPYGRILGEVSAVVSNGGYGTVLASLAAGVPLVIAGGAIDKPEIARRVAWSGAGMDLKTGRPTPAQVQDAVARVLGEPAYRRRARELGEAIAAAGGSARAANLVEERLLR